MRAGVPVGLSVCLRAWLAAVPACTRSEVDLPGRFLSLQVGATLNILARSSSSSSSSGGGSSSSSSSSSSSGGGSAAGLVAALHHGVDAAPAAAFVLRCQKPKTGGFGKWADQGGSDPLHTFFSLAGLQLMYDVQLSPSTFLAGWLAGSLAGWLAGLEWSCNAFSLYDHSKRWCLLLAPCGCVAGAIRGWSLSQQSSACGRTA